MKQPIYKITPEDQKRVRIHVPVGIINVAIGYVAWWLGAIFALAFLAYQVSEDWRICDQSFKDIKGYAWGLGIAGLIWFGLKVASLAWPAVFGFMR